MNRAWKISGIIFGVILIIISFLLLLYLKIIPALISNETILSKIENIVSKEFDATLVIDNPKLKTELSSYIGFSVDKIVLEKSEKPIIDLENFDIIISIKKIFNKKIIISELGADYIYANIDEVNKLNIKEEEKQKTKNDWKIDLFDSLLYLKECFIIYSPQENINLKLNAKDLEITQTHNPKFIKFDINTDITTNGKNINIQFNDNNSVFFKDRILFAQNSEIFINNSKIITNFNMDENNQYKLNVSSKKLSFADTAELIKSNIFIPNGKELLAIIDKINGDFDFDVYMDNENLNGSLNINKLNFIVPMVHNIPVTFNDGDIKLDNEKITIANLKGYYGKNKNNKIDFSGGITDYLKSFKTDITGFTILTPELTNDYMTPMIGFPVELTGNSIAKVDFGMLNGIMDTSVIFRLKKDQDILIDGASFTPTMLERGFRADMQIDGMNFKLKDLNYYLAKSFTSGVKANPILQLHGNFDLANNMAIKDIGFDITKPLPSIFLNVLMGQRIFRKGNITGNLEYIASENNLNGHLSMDEVFVPSQRMSIKKAELTTDNNQLHVKIDGKYRRTPFTFDGNIINEMKLPIIVKSVKLNIQDIDIEKILLSMARQEEYEAKKKAEQPQLQQENKAEDENDDAPLIFEKDILVIENGMLNVVKGVYKQINFGNMKANITLDRNGVLKIMSNRFDIAEGISSAHIFCDLYNQQYKLKLGIKDVNADVIATSLLNLPREISGKAKGFINIEADKSMKMNGEMKFSIQKGTIAKVGLIEYALNFISLMRNPIVMISPTTIIDIVNIPEGVFDDISGTIKLKDNNINMMMIKSTAPQLSSFIVGKYNLENADATLRIYTKFSNYKKGVSGALRNVSLNALANKIPLSSKNDSNYYESELKMIPPLAVDDKYCQVFLTKIDGDVQNNNFISSLKKIK